MNNTRYVLVAVAALGVVAGASAQSLFNNAAGRADVTQPEGLFTNTNSAGQKNSTIATGNGTYGYGAQSSVSNSMADDFTVGAGGWTLTGANLFMYQTNSSGTVGSAGSINGANVTIHSDNAGAPGSVVATGTFMSSVYTDLFRVSGTTQTSTARQIQFLTIDFGSVNLAAGSYWIAFNASGTGASGPWAPYLATTGPGAQQASGSANAMQQIGAAGAWNAVVDGGFQQDLPFYLNGQPVPEPASMIALGLGAAAIAARRRRKKA